MALELQGISVAPPRKPSPGASSRPEPKTEPPAGLTDAVRFTSQIAPILVARCIGCHNSSERRSGLSLATFEELRRGGDSGSVFVVGDPARSLLIGKLKGTAEGQRMPLEAAPLSEAEVELFERWILAGAINDGGSETSSLRSLIDAQRLESATAEELNGERRQLAEANWRLAFPDTAPSVVETEHFLVLGIAGEAALKETAQQAESLWAQLGRALRQSDDATPKGRLTLYVVTQYYDLSEFARMVENRALPRPPNESFWKVAGTDGYLAVRLESEQDPKTSPLYRGLAGLWVASRGGYPSWFEFGLADAVALKLSPGLPRCQRLESQILNLPATLAEPDEFLSQKAPTDVNQAAACSFVQFLMRNSRRFPRLLSAVSSGTNWESALTSTYGATQDELIASWWKSIARGGSRSR